MGKIYLVTGGARSGKSGFAEELCATLGGPVVYVATARPHGRDMASRIARHRERRPATWTTREAPDDLVGALPAPDATGVVMIECLHIWTANRLLASGDPRADGWWTAVQELESALVGEVRAMAEKARAASWHLVAVSSEVGLGPAPDPPRQRVFRDLLGRINETVGRLADDVVLVVCGLGLSLRRLAIDPSKLAR